ncbi:MAG: hypothetical protein ACREJM_11960 [Candidatus Saccharimonadales bacterium]
MSRLTARIRRVLHAILHPLKAAGRHCERTLARRLSQRYAGEITQFDDLARAMRELGEHVHTRLDKQEGFQWDHVALARRLARLEDHVEQLLRQAAPGLVPCSASDDSDGPATRAGATEVPTGASDDFDGADINAVSARESNRAECIPFRTPPRYVQANTSSQEAA